MPDDPFQNLFQVGYSWCEYAIEEPYYIASSNKANQYVVDIVDLKKKKEDGWQKKMYIC